MKKKIVAIIMTAIVLIGAAMPAAACSKQEIDDMIAAAQQLEQAHKPSCDLNWFLQRWGKADDHEEDEPAEDPETEEQTAEPAESEPEDDNPARHLIVPSIDALESAINTMNNLYKPTWGDPDD